MRGSTAIVGIAHSQMFRRGESPHSERRLALEAIVQACSDAGISPADVDGYVSYSTDTNDGPKMASALGARELRWSTLVWGGGGGGVAAAVAVAAAAVHSGMATNVAVVRALTQGDTGRLGFAASHYSAHYRAHAVATPTQLCALRTQRMLEHRGIPQSAIEAFVLAAYHHAQQNPGAAAFGKPLDSETYRSSRWISEPYHLYDCSRENDGAGCVIVTSAERAKDLRSKPAYILAAVQGAGPDRGELVENDAAYDTAGCELMAKRLWSDSRLRPEEVDVAQFYENFSGPAVASMLDFGFITDATAAERMTLANLTAPNGWLPVNTAGGNLADGYIHGISLVVEAVRQLRAESCNQVPDANVSFVAGGPIAPVSSAMVLGSEATL